MTGTAGQGQARTASPRHLPGGAHSAQLGIEPTDGKADARTGRTATMI